MKTIQNKNGLSIQYLNLSDSIDTTAFSELAYFFVEYQKDGKPLSHIIDEKQFELLSQGETYDYDWHNSVHLIKSEGLKLIEKYSFWGLENFYKMANQTDSPITRTHLFSHNIANDRFDHNHFTFVKLIENYNSKFAWLDIEGKIHCEPFVINGSPISELHNTKYFLDDFAEELSHRNDIAFITHTGRWEKHPPTILFAPLTGNEPTIGGVISEMEHHIEEGESWPEETEELSIIYYPNENNIQQLIEFNPGIQGKLPENKNKGNYFVERLILNIILGGEKFLIHPPQEEEVIVRKFRH